tara:strand:+ start:2179 stop:2367 length:189 start_codon:yes stop_codon:yes gene_type:complete
MDISGFASVNVSLLVGEHMENDTVWDAIENNYGKDKLSDHMLDDWLEAETQEEAEADGWYDY